MSGGQAGAALGAAARKHPASAGGLHASAETVPALAHELAWLVRPFHVQSPFSGPRAPRNLLPGLGLARPVLACTRHLARPPMTTGRPSVPRAERKFAGL